MGMDVLSVSTHDNDEKTATNLQVYHSKAA